MLTAGVDLAAESKGTALAVVDWQLSQAVLLELHLGVTDAQIVDVAGRVDKLGIDCPLGWPDEFVSFVAAHATNDPGAARVDGGMEWRRTLAYRETDRDVRRVTGRWPLSVSTDRLGLTAMRCAGLLARIDEAGVVVERSGFGVVAEVYPGASLRLWGLATAGYRADSARRQELLDAVQAAAPWLQIGDVAALMIASTDAFDAVIAALAARSAAIGASTPPPPQFLDRARREGWTALPTGNLADLLAPGEG